MGMRTRVMLATTSILVAVVAVLVFIIARNATSTIEEIILADMDETLTVVCSQLEIQKEVAEVIRADANAQSISLARSIARIIAADPTQLATADMKALAVALSVEEIHVTDSNGILTWGTNPEFFGLNFGANEQTLPFMAILSTPGLELVQEPMPRAANGDMFQYVGVSRIDEPGIVQIGISLEAYDGLLSDVDIQKTLPSLINDIKGGAFILNLEGIVIADSREIYLGQNLSGQSWFAKTAAGSAEVFDFEFGMTTVRGKSRVYDDKIVVTYLPLSTIGNYKNTTILTTAIASGIGLLILISLLYLFLTRIIIQPIETLNGELEDLQQGSSVDEVVVGGGWEMKQLVNSINEMLGRLVSSNETVDRLKTSEANLKSQLDAKNRIRQLSSDIEFRDILLSANNRVAECLLSSNEKNFGEILQQCLGILGIAAGANRTLLWKQAPTKDRGNLNESGLQGGGSKGDSLKEGGFEQQGGPEQQGGFEQQGGRSEGGPEQQGGRSTADSNESGLAFSIESQWWDDYKLRNKSKQLSRLDFGTNTPLWVQDLMDGTTFSGPSRLFPAQLHTLLEPQGIKSVLLMPVYSDNLFWGFFEYTYYDTERIFSKSEQSLLHSGALLIINGVSRNQMTVSILEAQREALARARAKSLFISSMSYGIRTPLNVVTGMATVGLGSSSHERKDYCLSKIEEASSHLLNIINDTLDVSKIELQTFKLAPVSFSFEKLFRTAAAAFKHRFDEKKLNFSVYIDRRIPSVLFGDEQRLIQVLANLLDNALKNTKENGKVSIVTKLLSKNSGSYTIRISVQDTGTGMTPQQQEQLFIPFVQARDTQAYASGETGLEMAISKGIVGLMGGEIWVESKIGKGSTIHFTARFEEGSLSDIADIAEASTQTVAGAGAQTVAASGTSATETSPQTAVALASSPAAAFASAFAPADTVPCAPAAVDDFSEYTVLIAEDIAPNREVIASLLEPTKINIEFAENGHEAVEKYLASPLRYSLILMDVQMPELDGFEATRRIRNAGVLPAQQVPIIAMTAYVFREDIENSFAAGMDDHIGKPIDFKELLVKLRKYLKYRV